MQALYGWIQRLPGLMQLLAWLIPLLFCGAVITWITMLLESRKCVDIHGKMVSIHKLHLQASPSRMSQRLQQLPPASIRSLKMQLWLDFLYMPFIFLLMSSISVFFVRSTCSCSPWIRYLLLLCLIPFLIWACDILENCMMLKILRHFLSGLALKMGILRLMKTGSLLKWALSALWLSSNLVCGTVYLLMHFQ